MRKLLDKHSEVSTALREAAMDDSDDGEVDPSTPLPPPPPPHEERECRPSNGKGTKSHEDALGVVILLLIETGTATKHAF